MTDVQAHPAEASAGEAFAFPLSFAQERLWFLHRLEPSSSAYNVPLVLRLRGELDVRALELALGSLVERHEALRTTFREDGGVPMQIVHPAAHSMALVDVTDTPETTRSEEAERRVLDEINAPFDLAEAPAVRTTLLRLAPDEHLLVITLHHIVADAWSLGVLRRDLAALYTAALGGTTSDLPDLPVQYADFAVWQRELFETDRLAEQRDYWLTRLTGAPTLLELPTDRPRPPVQSDRGGHVRTRLEPSLARRLAVLARQEDASVFMTLFSAFAALMFRYSGQPDFVIGTPIANRTRTEVEGLVGFFANTLAIRFDLSGNPTFRELVGRVRRTIMDAYAHQDFPFEQLVSELNPARSLSHTPLFQVLFQFQAALAHGAVEFPGLSTESLHLERARAKFDLGLFASGADDALDLSVEYSADLYERETVARLLGHLEVLLTAFVADPELRIEAAPLLTEAEVATLESWNATDRTFESSPTCIHEPFEARARETPDACAAVFGAGAISYRELNERSNQLARRLRALGVAEGGCVAISLERSFDVLVAVLAALKAGAAYCPLDPTYPQERLKLMLEDSGASAVVTVSSIAERLPAGSAPVLCLDRASAAIAELSRDDLGSSVDPERNAYILFTSGSTGTPKGVAMPHGPLMNLLRWQRDELGPRPVRTLQFASLSFDVAFQEIFSTWNVGGTVVLVDDEQRRDPETVLRLLDGERIERLFVPFIALQHLAEASVRIDFTPRLLEDVITAGEALQISPVIREFFARMPSCRLHNHYGPTESHVVTSYTLTGAVSDWPLRPPIGKPIANAKIHILDDRGARAPIGVDGNLHIAGPVLARGYSNRPELTKERFVPDPYAANGAPMYRTGDVARYLPSGDIEFLGRADDQVKIRGYRVEPGEVEAVLLEHPRLQDAAVVSHGTSGGDQRLVAYTVANGDAPSTAELQQYLGRRLPEFMIPGSFVALDALPTGATGKVDRRALPEPTRIDTRSDDVVPPRDELERRLVEIWQRALEVDSPVSTRADFFELGGHSLLAVRVIAMVEEALGVRLPLTSMFEASTVEGMAARVREQAENDGDWPTLVRLRHGGSRPPLFLLHGKDGELLHYRDLVFSLSPEQPVYGIQPIGLDGRGEPSLTIEEMASHYVGELRRFLPDGPYLLAGYCLSGVLAFEVAHQIALAGSPPAFVGLIDAGPYGHARTSRVDLERRKFADFRSRDFRGKSRWVVTRLRGLAGKVALKTHFMLYDAFARSGRRLPRSLRSVERALFKALSSYESPTSEISITLFRAADDVRSDLERGTTWTNFVKEIEICPIVGEGLRHDNIMRAPFANALAAEVDVRIEKALAAQQSRSGGARQAGS